MAILEQATQNYFKINFDQCSIRGRKVYVNFSTYVSTQDREKEKVRGSRWAAFFMALRQNLNQQYNNLVGDIEQQGLKSENIMSRMEPNKIDRDKYLELRARQDVMNDMEPYESLLQQGLHQYGDNVNMLSIPENIKAQLIALGFEEEWITDPVHITNGAEIYCGEYADEPINHTFYYNRLKTAMSTEIQNV